MKLKKASSTGGNTNQPPVDDASFSQDPMMGGDPGMGGDPNAMGGDSNAMGGDPNMMGDDPNAMGEDPNMMGDDPNAMGGDPGMIGGDAGMDAGADGQEGAGDDTMSIINQLSDTDREAVRAYAESMLSRDEEQMDGQNDELGGEAEQPVMESVIFTKRQLNKINEEFGPNRDYLDNDDNKKPLQKKNTKTTSNNSPFNPKKFK